MKRVLPPAGHPIRLRTIVKAFLSKADRKSFEDSMPSLPVVWVSSGTAALTHALQCLRSSSGRKQVILPAYSCPSILAAVIKAELEPVLCDTEPGTFRLNRDQLGSILNSNILAVIAVHLFGLPENIPAIRELAQRTGTFIIEDAAQAYGNRVTLGDDPFKAQSAPGTLKHLGTLGDIGIFSFGRGKPLSLLGGGAVAVNNPDLVEFVESMSERLPIPKWWLSPPNYFLKLLLYSVFFNPRFYWIPASLPWLRLGETHFTLDFEVAAMHPLIVRLGNQLRGDFIKIREQRISLTQQFTKLLMEFRQAFDFLPEGRDDNIALLRYPVILNSPAAKKEILMDLKSAGLGATEMYPTPLNEQNEAQEYLPSQEKYPNATKVAGGILTLPLHQYVTDGDINRIYEIFQYYLKNG